MRVRGLKKGLASLIASSVLILLAGIVFVNRQDIHDRLVLTGYDAPAAIKMLADGAGLSSRGRDLFYVNAPELHDKSTFSKVCEGAGDEQSNVLGCFNGTHIYIYNASDERFAGIEEVTAAHEMLHAAYARLNDGERQRVNELIDRQLEKAIEPHIKELITIYQRIEPDQIQNEMHSILATEQRTLLPELEQYFKQYFTDRNKVVRLAAQYRLVFDTVKRQQEALAKQLDNLATQINQSTAAINRRLEAYNRSIEDFNARAHSGEMTEAEFNRERPLLDAERLAINREITSNDTLRRQYERRLKEYESLTVEFTSLQNSISSKPIAPKSVE